MTFVVVGLSTGYMNYLYSNYGKLVYIAGLFIMIRLIKQMLNAINRMAGKL